MMMPSINFKTFLDILVLSLIILLISVMGGIGFDFAVGSKMISLHSLKNILVAAILFWFIRKAIDKEIKFQKTDLDFPVLIYLITFISASIFSSQPKVSFLYFRDFLLHIGMAYLLINNIDNKNKLEAILFILIIAVLYSVSRGIYHHIKMQLSYWNRNYYSFGGRAEFGAVTVLLIPILISFLMNYRKKTAASIFFILGLIILIMGLIISYSRGSWIGFTGVFLFLIILNNRVLKNWKFFLLILLTVVLLYLILPASIKTRIISIANFKQDSIGDRLPTWGSSLKMIKDFPFFGTGPGTYDVVVQKYKGVEVKEEWPRGWHAHNIFLHIAPENGIIGLVSFLIIIVISFRKCFELRNKIEDIKLKNLLDGIMLSLVGYFFCSQTTIFFANHNKNEKISMFLWFNIALIFIIENIVKKQEELNEGSVCFDHSP
ncbi:MAG: O-antigen ligase family protein [bacterium]